MGQGSVVQVFVSTLYAGMGPDDLPLITDRPVIALQYKRWLFLLGVNRTGVRNLNTPMSRPVTQKKAVPSALHPSRNSQNPRPGFGPHTRLDPAKVLQVRSAADVLADLLE